MPMECFGQKQYVQFLRKRLVGVDAQTGKFSWRYDRTIDPGANILTPIVVGAAIFSAGSRTGGSLIELQFDGDTIKTHELYFERGITPSIGGAVVVDGYLYGSAGQSLFCADLRTGKIQWNERAVGTASICFADRRLYVRGHSSNEIALAEPSPSGYREKGRFKQPNRSSTQAWPHPVVANGGLYLRDQQNLFCFEVAAK